MARVRSLIAAATMTLLSLAGGQSAFAADVGVSISVGDPRFYGRIDIGQMPPPRVIYEQPVIIQRPPTYVVREPLYLRVPPGHAKHWKKHCARYQACGRPVYFVRDDWYTDVYVPEHERRYGPPPNRGNDWEERHDHRHGHHGGHGHRD